MTERRRTGVLLCKNTRLNKASISCAQKYDLRSSYDQDSTKRAQKLSEIGHLMTNSFNFQGITSSNRGLRFQFAREISRLSGRDRETIKRYVEQEDFSIEVPIRQRRSSKTDAYREQVRQCGNLAFGRPPSRSLKAIRAGREGHPARTWKAIS